MAETKAVAKAPAPMNATERRELRKIVEAEFKMLATDLNLRAAEVVAEAKTDAAAEYESRTKECQKANDEVLKVVRDASDKIREIVRKYKEKGIEATGRYGKTVDGVELSSGGIDFVPAGKNEAVSKAASTAQRQVAAAQRSLDRQKLDVLKRLSLSAILSDEANQFLDDLPTADDILRLAAAEVQGQTAIGKGK